MWRWECIKLRHRCGLGLCFQWIKRGPRQGPVKRSFLYPPGLAANDQLLPVELLVQKEDQKVDIYFRSIE